ncbi:MarR family winged helix-turn-helix transcriptional regulator [Crystallibacter degradans]|uniref:MarR family winged helix-turn-helix transcriptional regulator n=1 Tax=Crystallibacter degradans TaxID=2726743 RepID=UPI0014735EE9|nr:MarR family winged helix-turn-helix transcriptional regulator [Arthrobacter sp. SF27]NMR29179.1 winged helix-turn-helix transcriptional regulator [Arthrobacter sp. SF27]
MQDLNNWPTPRLLSTAARLVEHAWNEKLAALGLTHAGVTALQVLKAEGPMVQSRLAAKIRVQASTMGNTLSRLEAHGHVTRVTNPADRRSQQVDVTGLGKTALEQARELERELTDGADAGVEELRERLAVIIRMLGAARWGETIPRTTRKAASTVRRDPG